MSNIEIPFELSSLSKAKNYQEWVYKTIEPFLGSRILEFGAGIGNMSKWLPLRERLFLTELDKDLFSVLQESVDLSDARISTLKLDLLKDEIGFLQNENLDTIISFNVLEHIDDDQAVVQRLSEILRSSKAPGPKRLISFVPAHNWAYGSMDKTYGHCRRYSRKRFENISKKVAPDAHLSMMNFNIVGLAGWFFNGRILKTPQIGSASVAAFEKICPFIRPFDNFIHKSMKLPLGQSLICVLQWN